MGEVPPYEMQLGGILPDEVLGEALVNEKQRAHEEKLLLQRLVGAAELGSEMQQERGGGQRALQELAVER